MERKVEYRPSRTAVQIKHETIWTILFVQFLSYSNDDYFVSFYPVIVYLWIPISTSLIRAFPHN